MDGFQIAWLQKIENELHERQISLAITATRLEDVATALSKIASHLEEIKYEKEVSTSNLRRSRRGDMD